MPPTPSSSPAYQFCTVEYLICASSSATSSTTAACNWFLSNLGAVQPSRYDTWEPSSATINVLSNWPDSELLIRKYVESSMGQRTPLGIKQNEPSEKTALLSAAKKLSLVGTTDPRYFLIRSGYSRIASVNEQKMTPCFFSFSL